MFHDRGAGVLGCSYMEDAHRVEWSWHGVRRCLRNSSQKSLECGVDDTLASNTCISYLKPDLDLQRI